jgi:hypothetical protein
MNLKVRINGSGRLLTLTQKDYKAAGGEASIYVNGPEAFKIYHDPAKALALSKIAELSKIGNSHVIVPSNLLSDANSNHIVGHVSKFVDNAEPLLKLFTRTFKDQNNVDEKMIIQLVRDMQLVTTDIHKANCLVVDYNELNILAQVGRDMIEPFYIDVDSYATPSFKATAIMDSVRDRRVSKIVSGHISYNPDTLSDWFSWGILAFWLYTNIHVFRGSHPNYKPKDKAKQMDDGISVFHKGVRVPPSVNDFAVIPKRHLDWFKDTFLDNHRSIPPLPDSLAPVAVPTTAVIINSTKQLEVNEVVAYPGTLLDVINLFGINYAITKSNIFVKGSSLADCSKAKKTLLCAASDGTAVIASLSGTSVSFRELNKGTEIGTIASNGMFARNGCIYTIANGKMIENSFTSMGSKIIHRVAELENISTLTSKAYEGCVIQDLLGKKYIAIPYSKNHSFSVYLPELDGHRVVEAKSERNISVIITEKSGKFHRFILVFEKDSSLHNVRQISDVAYDAINFTVTESGLCVLLASPTELELFKHNSIIETLADPPFDATMKLFSTPDGIFFINKNSVHQIKKK